MSTPINLEHLDAEARHARHDKREQYRARSREQWVVLNEPPRSWNSLQKADLDYEVSRSAFPNVTALRKLPGTVTVDPFGSRTGTYDPAGNPFLKVDGLGRPLRNCASTTGLTTAQAEAAYGRMLCANAMGYTLSTHVVISWPLVGIHGHQAVHDAQRKVFAVLRDMSRRWIARGHQPVAWLWTLERSQTKGLHSHFMFSCDPKRRGLLLRSIVRAIATFTGRDVTHIRAAQLSFQSQDNPAPNEADLVVAMTFPPKKLDGSASPSREIRAQWAIWRYIFKGVEPSYWDGANSMFRVLARCPQGRIQGKRWGYSSATLGDAAWGAFARSVDGDPTCVTRFVGSLTTIAYPDAIENFSPIWSA